MRSVITGWLSVALAFRVCPGFRQLGCRGESGVSDGVERYDGAVGEEARADKGLGARSGFAPVGPGDLASLADDVLVGAFDLT